MNPSVSTFIDPDLCIGCGLCVEVCPAGTISMLDGKAVVSGSYSMSCGHCQAVCPVDAVQVSALQEPFRLVTVRVDEEWLPFGDFDTEQLVRLMRSRRSCRNYLNKDIARTVLDDLVKIGTTAPSGTNSQKWTFTVVGRRVDMVELGSMVAEFYRALNRLAGNRLARLWSRLFGGNELASYYARYHDSVEESLLAWDLDGTDKLFHGATAAIIVGAAPDGSCPREDALLATQNILLAAHSMGIGSCLIGYAVEAINRQRGFKQKLAIPEDESVYAVIALGYPAETYQRVTGRLQPLVRYPFNK